MKRSVDHSPSPLLEVLDQRHKALGLGDGKPYRTPRMTPVRAMQIEEATDLHREAHPSDPFAAERIRLHMTRGLELVSDVKADARSLLLAKSRREVMDVTTQEAA